MGKSNVKWVNMKDRVKIKIESGKGGDGIIAFDQSRKADGGNGGKGGDIYLQGDVNLFDFTKIYQNKEYKAENGQMGMKNKRTGSSGEDLVIHIPLVTKILNEDGSEIVTISKHGDKVRLLKGGAGGLGNFTLRGEGWDGKLTRTKGEEEESKSIVMELNLKADAIFLGYPNAGKSSIINSLTNAKYRVAPYQFTTLEPQLAVMDRHILMDLPGLIEGTHKGKGLGTEFLKHTNYANLLVHCVSLENEDLLSTYKSMREEFKKISEYLYSLPELILFTKADIYSNEQLEEVKKSLKKQFKNKEYLVMSVFRAEDVKELATELKKRLGSISDSVIKS